MSTRSRLGAAVRASGRRHRPGAWGRDRLAPGRPRVGGHPETKGM